MDQDEEGGSVSGGEITGNVDMSGPHADSLHTIPITTITVVGHNESVAGIINAGESFSVAATYQAAGVPDGLDAILLAFHTAKVDPQTGLTSYAPVNVTSQDPNAPATSAGNELLATVTPTFDNSTDPPTPVKIQSFSVGPITLNNPALKSVVVNAQKVRNDHVVTGSSVTASLQVRLPTRN